MIAQGLGPTTERERYLILDVLRGLALADIALANFPEFALWTFLSPEEQAAMPTAEVDQVVRFLQFASSTASSIPSSRCCLASDSLSSWPVAVYRSSCAAC